MTKKTANGFTLVELTIAIAFLSILLIAILTLTLTAGKLYVKGDTNKTVNQAARDFSDVVRRDFLATGTGLISDVITLDAGSAGNPLESGRICLGAVTYLWNTAGLLNDTSAAANSVRVTMGSGSDPIRFVRIVRPQQPYCSKDGSGNYPMNISSTESATELFDGNGRDYALYSMQITPVAESGDKGMYRILYTLGTNEADTTEKGADGYVQCKPNSSVAANFDYCSVNDFDMMVRIGGTK